MNDGASPLGILGLSVVGDKMHVHTNAHKTLQKRKQMSASLLNNGGGTGEAAEMVAPSEYEFTDEVSE